MTVLALHSSGASFVALILLFLFVAYGLISLMDHYYDDEDDQDWSHR